MRVAKRIETLPPYLFAELDKKLSAKRAYDCAARRCSPRCAYASAR